MNTKESNEIMLSDQRQGKYMLIIWLIVTVALLVLLGIFALVDSQESMEIKVSIFALGWAFWLMWFMLMIIHKISFDVSQRMSSLEQQLEELRNKEAETIRNT